MNHGTHRTHRQRAGDYAKSRRAAMRKARWCKVQAKRMIDSFGDHGRAAIYTRLASSWVRDARWAHRNRLRYLKRARYAA